MAGAPFTIRVEDMAGTIRCHAGETIVGAMERTAMLSFRTGKEQPRVPVGCRQGGCGVCRVQVIDGPYRVLAMSRTHVTEDEQREGYALACRLVPDGDLTLRLALRTPARPADSRRTDIHSNA